MRDVVAPGGRRKDHVALFIFQRLSAQLVGESVSEAVCMIPETLDRRARYAAVTLVAG